MQRHNYMRKDKMTLIKQRPIDLTYLHSILILMLTNFNFFFIIPVLNLKKNRERFLDF